MEWDPWIIGLITYFILAVATAIPVVRQLLSKPEPENVPRSEIQSHVDFSGKSKSRIEANYARIAGALGFWKNQARNNRYLNAYVAWWVIPSSILVPTLTQATAGQDIPSAAWLITLISTHAAIALVLVQRLKTETNFRAYREGESAFYDVYRRLMDNPRAYGETEREQLASYFRAVEKIRKEVRGEELTNLANLTS